MKIYTFLKKIINKILSKSNYILVSKNQVHSVLKFSELWQLIDDQQREFISPYLVKSKSQYSQDLFILSELAKHKLPPFFVEFGATDGVNLSNTYLLEKYFNWNGILSEPAKIWEDDLRINRKCIIDTRCVFNLSKDLVEFSETLDPNKDFKVSSPELSTISKYENNDDWASNIRKQNSKKYFVETVTLNDLLLEHNAPFNIGYLSIDTEGSELDILRKFDFTKYRIEIISIEHNNNVNNRNEIYKLLSSNGYKIKYKNIFHADDIYVLY